MRILVATYAPLTPETGAGQVALNLGEGLRAQGHDVEVWSTAPTPPGKWWEGLLYMRRALARKVSEGLQGSGRAQSRGGAPSSGHAFDLIDAPAPLITAAVRRAGRRVIARSVQPDLLYAFSSMTARPTASQLAYSSSLSAMALEGWHRADRLACLGSLELAWMKRHIPWIGRKAFFYMHGLSAPDSEAIRSVRESRTRSGGRGVRYLWMGRWVRQKGTERLTAFLQERLRPEDTVTLAGCGEVLGLSARWTVRPQFHRAELPALLAAHDVGLFTSTVEGWGLSLNEMLESGLTVYATEAGGVADLRPYFPQQLRSFPPPIPVILSERLDDLTAYDDSFNWNAIAREYFAHATA
ncbi:MAG: glycosyltransferase family 4 protein [Myxococcaceae bacterium]